jgi:archaeosortase B (VPXXXP-CTERM-specific)
VNKRNQTGNNQKPRPTGRGFSSKPAVQPAGNWFKAFWARYHHIILPLITFFVVVGIFIVLYYRITDSRPFHGFEAVTAAVTGFLLNLTGRGVVVRDTVVSSSQFAFQIVDLCTAVMPMLILTAAILAYPSRLKEKAFGIVMGLIVIFVINQVRLVSLFYIGAYAPGIFETAHLLVWQSLMILLAVGIWLVWVYKYVRSPVI